MENNHFQGFRIQTVNRRNISIDTAEYTVGSCDCPTGHKGVFCDECMDGYYRPSGVPLDPCIPCNCNGHTNSCDSITGACINCTGNTDGDQCETCTTGYTGIDCDQCDNGYYNDTLVSIIIIIIIIILFIYLLIVFRVIHALSVNAMVILIHLYSNLAMCLLVIVSTV